MKFKSLLTVCAVAGLFGQSALAGVITTSYAGGAFMGGASSVGYQNGSIAPSPNGSGFSAVGIGGDHFTATPNGAFGLPAGGFDAWCVDIYHWLATPSAVYDVLGTAELAADLSAIRSGTPTGATRVQDLNKLANAYYYGITTAPGAAHSQADSAAFQMAVWAITYGAQVNGKYSLNTSPSFQVDASTLASAAGQKAQTWLNNLATASATASYSVYYLTDNASSGVPVANRNRSQDLVVFVKNSGGQIPEPGSLALVGLALLGAGLSRVRKA